MAIDKAADSGEKIADKIFSSVNRKKTIQNKEYNFLLQSFLFHSFDAIQSWKKIVFANRGTMLK